MACWEREIDGRGNLRLILDTETTKAIIERANETTLKEFVRLCEIAEYADMLKIGEYLQTRLARNSAGILRKLYGEADIPASVEGGQIHSGKQKYGQWKQ